MKDIYEEIKRINKLDPASSTHRMCKISEEVGELAQAVNKTLGRKVVSESREEVINLIKEEAADSIQCILSLLDSCSVNFEKIRFESLLGNCNLNDIYGICDDVAEELIELEINKGYMFESSKKGYFSLMTIRAENLIMSLLRIAGFYEITLGDIIETIKVKNVKWESVIKKIRTV